MRSDGMMARSSLRKQSFSSRHPVAALPGAGLGGISLANPDEFERTRINLVADFISWGK